MPIIPSYACHNKILCLLILPLLVACNQDRPPRSNVLISDGTVYFKGYITEESINTTIELLKGSDNRLRINSEGGSNTPAIKLANYIYENETEVVFQIQCYSACANYILPAARKGFVKRGTVVGWHGGAYQEIWEVNLDEDQAAKQRLDSWKKIETELYLKLKIDRNINIYGLIEDYESLLSEPSCMKLLNKGDWQGWTYTISDLKKMGVKIQFEDKKIPLSHRGGNDIQCYIYPFNRSPA